MADNVRKPQPVGTTALAAKPVATTTTEKVEPQPASQTTISPNPDVATSPSSPTPVGQTTLGR